MCKMEIIVTPVHRKQQEQGLVRGTAESVSVLFMRSCHRRYKCPKMLRETKAQINNSNMVDCRSIDCFSQNLICIKRVRNKHFLQPHLYPGDWGLGGAGQEMGKIPMLPKSDLFLSHFLSHLTKVKARLNLGSLTECQVQNLLMSFGCIERFNKSPSFPSKMYPP